MCQNCNALQKALPGQLGAIFRGITRDAFGERLPVPPVEGALWSRNDQHTTWADLEDALYLELVEGTIAVVTHLLDQMGLGAPTLLHLDKGITVDLLKSKDSLDRYKYLPKSVIKYLTDGKAWTRKELAEIEKLLTTGLGRAGTIAEKYMVKGNALAALMQAFDRAGVKVPALNLPDLPVTIEARKRLPAPWTKADERLARLAERRGEPELAPQPKEYRLRADRGAPDQPVLPLTDLEEEAIKWAQLHAGEKIATQNQYIKDAVRELVIQARKGRWTPDELRQALLNRLGEFNRDWRRIAITELADCMSNAYLATLKDGDWVVGQADATACDWCKKHIHGKVFRYRRAPGDPATEVWVGKSNYGRRKADWVPCCPAHPNCRCRWVRVNPRFQKVTADGWVDLKTPEEILAERAALKSFFGEVLIKGLDLTFLNQPAGVVESLSAPNPAYKLDEDRVPKNLRWEFRPTVALKPSPQQTASVVPEKLGAVREAIRAGKALPPILITPEDYILDGHNRWYGAQQEGLEWVAVIVAPVRVVEAVEGSSIITDDIGALAQEAMRMYGPGGTNKKGR